MSYLVPSALPQHLRGIVNEDHDIVGLQWAGIDRPATTLLTVEQSQNIHGQIPDDVSGKVNQATRIVVCRLRILC